MGSDRVQSDWQESEAEKISRIYLEHLSPDPQNSAIKPSSAGLSERAYDLSIIVPCYNTERYLEMCIDSVLSQDLENRAELILIDDGSTDRTAVLLDQYQDRDHIKVIHQTNQGLSGARNRGIQEAQGRYLLFLDSDDYLMPHSLETAMQCAISEDADLVDIGMRYVPASSSQLPDGDTPISQMVRTDAFSLPGYACGKLYRADIFDQIVFPVGYWFEDSLVSWLVFPICVRSYQLLHSRAYCYRQNPGGISAGASRGAAKSVDTWWITEQMSRDFRLLRRPDSQAFYELVLEQIILNYVRMTALNDEEAQLALFYLTDAWFSHFFSDRHTDVPRLSILERSLRLHHYAVYSKACAAAWNTKPRGINE